MLEKPEEISPTFWEDEVPFFNPNHNQLDF